MAIISKELINITTTWIICRKNKGEVNHKSRRRKSCKKRQKYCSTHIKRCLIKIKIRSFIIITRIGILRLQVDFKPNNKK
jgi:hypothetical protein